MSSVLRHLRQQCVAYLALFVALGGTSYAATNLPAGSVGSKQLKKNAVTTVKIEKGAVTASKIDTKGLTVPLAQAADSAPPLAYAHILSDGTLDSADSKNVTAVSSPIDGWYCMKVSVPVHGVIATVDSGDSGGDYGFASGVLASSDPDGYIASDCPSGSNAFVGTAAADGSNAPRAIWVLFY